MTLRRLAPLIAALLTLGLGTAPALASGPVAHATRTGHHAHRRSCRHAARSHCRHRRGRVAHRATLPAHPAKAPAPAPALSDTPPAAPVASPPPAVVDCAGADLAPDQANIAAVESATLCLVNDVRAEHGLAALVTNADLAQAAQRHTDDMLARDYFEHVGPAGDTPLSRIRDTGYLSDANGYALGENIAWGTLELSTPRAIVQAWVNSPEHLANILDADYRQTAMAVDPAVPASMAHQAGATYTQDFGALLG